jgi:hypothetical protein
LRRSGFAIAQPEGFRRGALADGVGTVLHVKACA